MSESDKEYDEWLDWLEEHAENAVKGIDLAIKDLQKICLRMPNCHECPFDGRCPIQAKDKEMPCHE